VGLLVPCALALAVCRYDAAVVVVRVEPEGGAAPIWVTAYGATVELPSETAEVRRPIAFKGARERRIRDQRGGGGARDPFAARRGGGSGSGRGRWPCES